MVEALALFASSGTRPSLHFSKSGKLKNLLTEFDETLGRIAERIERISGDAELRDALIHAQLEGIVVVSTEGKILILNDIAREQLGVRRPDVRGRAVEEVLRNPVLQSLFERSLEALEPIEEEMTLVVQRDERAMRVYGRMLKGKSGQQVGALIVMTDITQMKALEKIRREFVANVSHELKTPITAIKGSVETLLDTSSKNEADTTKFLSMISRQADRLNSLFEDLLSLSRIEQDRDMSDMRVEVISLKEVLKAALQSCEFRATEKKIHLELEAEHELRVLASPLLLEQAVINLINNAIDYSDTGKRVLVRASVESGRVCILVEDQGCGIEEIHLPRIFERFYRVDKARSRKSGGTGLGLAIVKHIAQAHGGYAEVESKPGVGSKFSIVLSAA